MLSCRTPFFLWDLARLYHMEERTVAYCPNTYSALTRRNSQAPGDSAAFWGRLPIDAIDMPGYSRCRIPRVKVRSGSIAFVRPLRYTFPSIVKFTERHSDRHHHRRCLCTGRRAITWYGAPGNSIRMGRYVERNTNTIGLRF